MAKINDGAGSGKPIPSSDDFSFEPDESVKTEIDDLEGRTFAVEVGRPIKSKFTAGDKDSFETESLPDIVASASQTSDPNIDIENLRKKSDTGLTVQLKQMLRQNIKG